MTTVQQVRGIATQTSRPDANAYPASSLRLDWLIAAFSMWIIAGLFIDGWAHQRPDQGVETFFTPWHAVLYSGLLASGIALGATFARNLARGYDRRRALPRGYMLSLLGFLIFALGGIFDFMWHDIFGFEADVEALLSPAHLVLATGAVLMLSGPFRSAWSSAGTDERRGWSLLPALLSLLALISLFTFFTQFANIVTHPHYLVGQRGEGGYALDSTTVNSVLIPAAILSGFVLLAIRRWTLPPGALTLIIGVNSALMFWLSESYSGENWPVLIGALAGGLSADILYAVLKPSANRVWRLRWFALLMPFAAFLLMVLALSLLGPGIWWRIHMWLGVPIVAGIIGLCLSFLVVPPAIPANEPA